VRGVELDFLDRHHETERLNRLLRRKEGALGVVYGRRRCGKTRLLTSVATEKWVFYLADERDSALQRASLAGEMARVLPGFDEVTYPDWNALLSRWWREAPVGSVLALDEFPSLVLAAPELPGLLQRFLDLQKKSGLHVIVCGSSQRMMEGLVLDRNAPLYGRAVEILKIAPLEAGWIEQGLKIRDAASAVESYAVWGGVPRYWELASEHDGLANAIRDLVLDPLGILHLEPLSLLLDDIREAAQSSSILQLIGQRCHRLSEIAGRLERPATALSRPLQRLVELGYVRRDQPALSPDSRKSLYRVADPFVRFWYTFVAPNRSRLERRQFRGVEAAIGETFSHFVATIWEELARQSVTRSGFFDEQWDLASAWWGTGLDRRPAEVDVVAESVDRKSVLLGSVKWQERCDAGAVAAELRERASALPFIQGRRVRLAMWLKRHQRPPADTAVMTPRQVLDRLR
jgi:AAA+ ATPase superfamily predicted ATPase